MRTPVCNGVIRTTTPVDSHRPSIDRVASGRGSERGAYGLRRAEWEELKTRAEDALNLTQAVCFIAWGQNARACSQSPLDWTVLHTARSCVHVGWPIPQPRRRARTAGESATAATKSVVHRAHSAPELRSAGRLIQVTTTASEEEAAGAPKLSFLPRVSIRLDRRSGGADVSASHGGDAARRSLSLIVKRRPQPGKVVTTTVSVDYEPGGAVCGPPRTHHHCDDNSKPAVPAAVETVASGSCCVHAFLPLPERGTISPRHVVHVHVCMCMWLHVDMCPPLPLQWPTVGSLTRRSALAMQSTTICPKVFAP